MKLLCAFLTAHANQDIDCPLRRKKGKKLNTFFYLLVLHDDCRIVHAYIVRVWCWLIEEEVYTLNCLLYSVATTWVDNSFTNLDYQRTLKFLILLTKNYSMRWKLNISLDALTFVTKILQSTKIENKLPLTCPSWYFRRWN